jgi:hypothetical protein
MPNDVCQSTIYDPALNVTVPTVDAREKFSRLSQPPQSGQAQTQVITAHKTSLRQNAKRPATAPSSTNASADDSRSIGFWPIPGQMTFARSTAIRYLILFPDAVGGSFSSSSYLYLTGSNRSEKGTESHIAFAGLQPPEFWIWDWSLAVPSAIRQVPIASMAKYLIPVQVQSAQQHGLLVYNQTRLLTDTTWANCVHLGVFQNGTLQYFDTVYSNSYTLESNTQQQPNANGFWGPELETFQNYTQQINPMGFSGCWFIQDDMLISQDNSNTELHFDDFGPQMIIQHPCRDFLVC